MNADPTAVHGFAAHGFGPVAEQFKAIAASGQLGEGGAAFAAYHRGNLVVDLWTGMADTDTPWVHDTRNTWMSVTKMMTTMCAQALVDRAVLDLDAAVATYWPEFGQNGKDAVTVRQVLASTSGVIGSAEISALIDLEQGVGYEREDEILEALSRSAPVWEPGTEVGYHCFSLSWIIGELVRRIDGRSLGGFFRDEIAVPLGVEGARIGTPVGHHEGVAALLPNMYPEGTPDVAREYMDGMLAQHRDPSTPAGVTFTADGTLGVLDRLPEVFNRPEGLVTEMGGSNLTATARDTARIMATMADPAGVDGVALWSPATMKAFTEIQTDKTDVCILLPISRALGYCRNIPLPGRPALYGPNPETVGHAGFGGQAGFADPVANVAGAFTRNHHTLFQIEGFLLTTALYGCLS